jgi:hypothetical protein
MHLKIKTAFRKMSGFFIFVRSYPACPQAGSRYPRYTVASSYRGYGFGF